MRILVTGCAGFIGYHLSKNLIKNPNYHVFGLDNLNNYYDVKLKRDRIANLRKTTNGFKFSKIDICNKNKLNIFFKRHKFNYVFHLAAQAGVRFSIQNPKTYFNTNISGFFNILECCKNHNIKHLIFASSSSVYGATNIFPLKENSDTDHPLSFYAATKKSNEVMAYAYSNIYNLPCTGLRFFTVYGPYGRPDMALFKFTKAILNNKKIELYNKGEHLRDFTYIDDVISYVTKLLKKTPKNKVPFSIYNVGSNKPYHLKVFLSYIQKILNKKAKVKLVKAQIGDIYKTHASVSKISKLIGSHKNIKLEKGIKNFINWYKSYFIK